MRHVSQLSMKILITGSEGFIGRNLSAYLEKRGYEVLRADIAESAEIRVDVSSLDERLRKFISLEFNAVINLVTIAKAEKDDRFLTEKSLGCRVIEKRRASPR